MDPGGFGVLRVMRVREVGGAALWSFSQTELLPGTFGTCRDCQLVGVSSQDRGWCGKI